MIDELAPEVQVDQDPLPSPSAVQMPAPPAPLPSATIANPMSIPSETEALSTLRKLLQKPTAQWSSDGQRQAVITCLQWAKDLIVILPTGSGKSAIIATVATLEECKVTAVLCPLKSLFFYSNPKHRLAVPVSQLRDPNLHTVNRPVTLQSRLTDHDHMLMRPA